jgi:hypothetical protein
MAGRALLVYSAAVGRRLLSCVSITLLASRLASAQSPPSYELEYDADASCPDKATFSQMVDTQLRQFDGSMSTPARLQVRVTMRSLPGSAWVRFQLDRPDGTSHERELREGSCAELAPALAFVLAYALGGRERSGPPPREATSELPATSAPAPSPARGPTPVSDAQPSGRPRKFPWRLGLGVELGARSGLGPNWTLIEGASLQLQHERARFPRLDVRAAFLRGNSSSRVHDAFDLQFSWLAGRLEACPLHVPLKRGLSVLPCVGAHVGRFQVEGRPENQRGARGKTANELWLDAVGSLRFELVVWRVLALQARGEAVLPLTPYEFAFDNPYTPAYRVPRVAAAVSLGLGLRFP